MEEARFDLLLNPPKILKVRMILAALHGQVKRKMRQTLKGNLDWEYELAVKVLAQRR